jgi:DegV family protein with EDD domain
VQKIAVMTDTNSMFPSEEAEKNGVTIVPMPFFMNGKEYLENVTCTQEKFYKMLEIGADVSTSQPAIGDLSEKWDKLLLHNDKVIYIPMSSSLSGACYAAKSLAAGYSGKVIVVDNKRVAMAMEQSVYDALYWIRKGCSAEETANRLEATSRDADIYVTVNTLKYLKKSGRVTAAAALMATAMNLKPVLKIDGGKLDSYKRARGMTNAMDIMIEAVKTDIDRRFLNRPVKIQVTYSGDINEAKSWLKLVKNRLSVSKLSMKPLPISIGCHVGAGALGISCSVDFEYEESDAWIRK